MISDDDIGAYYEQIRLKRDAAWKLVREAREKGTDSSEIARLEELAWDAGNTGD